MLNFQIQEILTLMLQLGDFTPQTHFLSRCSDVVTGLAGCSLESLRIVTKAFVTFHECMWAKNAEKIQISPLGNFSIFQDGGCLLSSIIKFRNFAQSARCRGHTCFTMLNFVKISQTVAEIWRFFVIFQDGGRPPSWILKFQKF